MYERLSTLFQQRIALWKIALPILLLAVALPLIAASCTDPAQSSYDGQQTAINKWGQPGNGITTYYEYEQMQEIYKLRDDPKLILNAYLFSQQTGQLTCLGKVEGFGVPYGTQESPPSSGTQAVPEPNALYPSQDTSADWIQLIGPDGKPHVTFAEPDLIITDQTLACKPLSS